MRTRILLWSLATTSLMWCVTCPLRAAHPVVAGFARFHAARPDAEGGRLLLAELNCVACHKVDQTTSAALNTARAPLLGDAGARFKPDWLARYLLNPQKTKPGTAMPDVLAGRSDAQKKQDVEALVHYLSSLAPASQLPHLAGKIGDGRKLFNSIGCAACHAPIGADAAALSKDRAVVPLADLGAKYQHGSALAHFLMTPHRFHPGGRMPAMNLSKQDALSIAAAFGLPAGARRIGTRAADDQALKEAGVFKALRPGMHYEIFEGTWNTLPDFDRLKPVDAGVDTDFKITKAKGKDYIGYRFRGYIAIEKQGLYTFYTASDDGSALYIGRDLVVDNDGVHGAGEQAGSITLKPGLHAITVTWFEHAGGEELTVSYDGPGISKRQIPPAALKHLEGGKLVIGALAKPGDEFTPQPALVERGKKLFAQVGCAACHQLSADDKPVAPSSAPQPLASLKVGAGKGCLGAAPTPRAPYFAFSEAQVKAINLALGALDTLAAADAATRADRTMTAMNCYACHVRKGKGGPEPGRDSYFVSTGDDMGEEGRIPPHLSDVGAKLTQSWLNEMLAKGTKVRPYMPTRMPVFAAAAVAHLADDFERADAVSTKAAYPKVTEKQALIHGRQLVGKEGMSCITCHQWNGQKAHGIQAMDLVHMPNRLKRQWYGRYMLDPAGLRPGTRMPQFWPDGKSTRPDIMDGKTGEQIEAMWQYLSRGGNAPPPQGLNPNEIVLKPQNGEAVLYRSFIAGAGPRAIGVGYPQQLNIAWDANHLRLALIWKGDFIDASKHWVGRGPGFQGPYGYGVVAFADGPPLAVLEPDGVTGVPKDQWPGAANGKLAGFQFVGYQLDKQRRPVFLYRFGDVKVTDYIKAEGSDKPYLRRMLTFEGKSPAGALWFRAAAANPIEARKDGSYKVGSDGLVVSVESQGAPVVRGNELLIRVNLRNGKATIVQEMRW